MAVNRKGTETRVVAITIVVLIVLAVLGLALFETRTASSSSSSSSSHSGSSASQSTQSNFSESMTEQQLTTYATDSSGIQIQVALNTTMMPKNGAVLAQVSLHNTLDQNLSLSVESSSDQAFGNWSEYNSFCGDTGQFGTLFGYALFSGHYTAENFSVAPTPLQLAPQVPLSCFGGGGEYGTVIFLPNSSIGVINGGQPHEITEAATTAYCVNYPNGSTGCGPGGGLVGYWDTNALIADGTEASPDFVRLSAGEYTLVVKDAWGGAAFARFEVTSASALAVACPSTTCESLSNVPAGPLKVESVRASQYLCADCGPENGESFVRFEVVFKNTGSSLVYMLSGPGLLTMSVPANSTVLRPVTSSVCASQTNGPFYLSTGQNFTWDGPSCTGGLLYQLAGPGSAEVTFTIDWGLSYNGMQNTTTISAELIFP